MWKHKSRFKGHEFLGNYEFTRAGVRRLTFKNARTGRETKPYRSHEAAKADGWMRVQA